MELNVVNTNFFSGKEICVVQIYIPPPVYDEKLKLEKPIFENGGSVTFSPGNVINPATCWDQ